MNKIRYKDITLMQFACMIHGSQLGNGTLTLPAQLAKSAGTDGWISLIIGWAIALLSSVILIQVMKRHPEDTGYDLLSRYFGKVAGGMLQSCFILYFAFAYFSCFISTISILKLQILNKTPAPLVALLFLIPTYMIARNQVRILSRYAELTFWGFLWLLLAYIFPLREAHWLHLLPVLKEGWSPVLATVQTGAFPFLGLESAFILYPYLKDKKDAIKGVIIGNTITLIVLLTVVTACFVFLSPDDITSYKFPAIKVNKTVQFRFLDRVEIVIMVAYLFILSRVWILNLYYAAFGASRLLGKQDHTVFVRSVLAATLLASLFFKPSEEQLATLHKLLGIAGDYLAFAFPLFLFAYTRMFGRFLKGARDEARG